MKRWPIVFFGCLLLTFAGLAQSSSSDPKLPPPPDERETFRLGMAGYTFVKMDIDSALAIMEAANVRFLSIKDFHLPLQSTAVQIADFHRRLAKKGVTGYAVGPIYMKTEQEVDQAFDYAKRVGVKLIVGVPNHELLPYVNKKVQAFDMRYAIHNHGPDMPLYPDADDIWSHIKDLDPRMGICLDIGHDTRNGKDPIADLKKYHRRIFDIHLKDVSGALKQSIEVELGRGIIPLPALVTMLRKVTYTGKVSLEHERNMTHPQMGIAESVGYFRALLVAIPPNLR